MDINADLDRITHPLRLAKGPHRPGSDTGCAMNVISYINGDEHITDFPSGSATPLAVLVQASNDLLAGPDGYLSPDNSVLALELAWHTVGTANVPDTVVHAWLAELLANPSWGAVRYANITAIKAIQEIAALHRAAAAGDMPAVTDWAAAARAARAIDSTSETAGAHALRAAYQSTTGIENRATVNAVTAHVAQAHALASWGTMASRVVELTRQAIGCWRELAGGQSSSECAPSFTLGAERATSFTLETERAPSFTLEAELAEMAAAALAPVAGAA